MVRLCVERSIRIVGTVLTRLQALWKDSTPFFLSQQNTCDFSTVAGGLKPVTVTLGFPFGLLTEDIRAILRVGLVSYCTSV